MIKSRRMRWAGHVRRTMKMNEYKVLVGKYGRKMPLGTEKNRM
jgi:hypothetical protein